MPGCRCLQWCLPLASSSSSSSSSSSWNYFCCCRFRHVGGRLRRGCVSLSEVRGCHRHRCCRRCCCCGFLFLPPVTDSHLNQCLAISLRMLLLLLKRRRGRNSRSRRRRGHRWSWVVSHPRLLVMRFYSCGGLGSYDWPNSRSRRRRGHRWSRVVSHPRLLVMCFYSCGGLGSYDWPSRLRHASPPRGLHEPQQDHAAKCDKHQRLGGPPGGAVAAVTHGCGRLRSFSGGHGGRSLPSLAGLLD